jgi:hypothetical protein
VNIRIMLAATALGAGLWWTAAPSAQAAPCALGGSATSPECSGCLAAHQDLSQNQICFGAGAPIPGGPNLCTVTAPYTGVWNPECGPRP